MLNPPHFVVYYYNHFDLLWRRGWRRGYEYEGLYYRSYADIEEAIISRYLQLAIEEDASFVVEQALSLREYLRRHPDAEETFAQLAREGRFELLGSGEAIIDLNMCSGETMVRNLASGIVYARERFGQRTHLACHNDGFGSSAQFPQVVRGCGLRGVNGLSYSVPDAPYWRGIDGSTVLAQFEAPGEFLFYDHCYYEPCLICTGHGVADTQACPACEGTGLRLAQGVYPDRPWANAIVDSLPSSASPFAGRYIVCSEEMLPDAELPAQIRRRNQAGAEQYWWRTQSALLPLWNAALERVDDQDIPLSSRVENNPIHSGTLVSRIRVKQAARRAESVYYAAEKMVTLRAAENGDAGRAATIEMGSVWLEVPLLYFHDSVTGTHIDPAMDELLDTARVVEQTALCVAAKCCGGEPISSWTGDGRIMVWNPHGHDADLPVELPAYGGAFRVSDSDDKAVPLYRQPGETEVPIRYEISPGVPPAIGAEHWRKRGEEAPASLRFLATDVPPLSWKTFDVTAGSPEPKIEVRQSLELGDYSLRWEEGGISSIRHRSIGTELLGGSGAGHLIVEDDVGDPWGTREFGRKRRSCLGMTRCMGARMDGDAAEVVFAGRFENNTFGRETDPSVFGLEWKQTVRLLRGLPYVEFEYEIFWQSVNRRLRVVFPSRSITDTGLYSIPCGTLERERYEQAENFLWSPNGDWPALHFVASKPGEAAPGLAIFNQGTPSARIEDGNVLISLLRSPGFGHCLTRPAQEYPMPLEGMRDGGYHRFRLFLMPHTGENSSQLMRVGHHLNQEALAFKRVGESTVDWSSEMALKGEGVSLSSVKKAFVGHGTIVRLTEERGRNQTVNLTLPPHVTRVQVTNLLEDVEAEVPIREGAVTLNLRAHRIATLLLT